MFDFHVHNGTHKVAPFACSTAAILWEDGPEGSRTHSQRAGAGPPDAAQVAPQLRGVTSASPFFQGPQFCNFCPVRHTGSNKAPTYADFLASIASRTDTGPSSSEEEEEEQKQKKPQRSKHEQK